MDDIIYYQGSDAYNYLCERAMLDEQDEENIVNINVLGRELMAMEQQYNENVDKIIEQSSNLKQNIKYGIYLPLLAYIIQNQIQIILLATFIILILYVCGSLLSISLYDIIMIMVLLLSTSKIYKQSPQPSNEHMKMLVSILDDWKMAILELSKQNMLSLEANLIYKNICYYCKDIQKQDNYNEILDCVTIHKNINKICKQIKNQYQNTLIDGHKDINLDINKRIFVFIKSLIKAIYKIIDKSLKCTVLQVFYKEIYENLKKYKEILEQSKQKQSNQNTNMNKNSLNEKMNERYEQYQRLLIQELKCSMISRNTSSNSDRENEIPILNLIKLQLIHKHNAIKYSYQTNAQCQQYKSQTSEDGSQYFDPSQTKATNNDKYYMISTDGQYNKIEEEDIVKNKKDLAIKLNNIIAERIKNQKQKQEQNKRRKQEERERVINALNSKQQAKYEHRNEGFRINMKELLAKKKVQEQVYLQ